jgi:excisionase family DNA binding protein
LLAQTVITYLNTHRFYLSRDEAPGGEAEEEMIGRPKGSKNKKRPPGYVPVMPVMTVAEVCDCLRINKTTLYRIIKRHKIPYFKIGMDYRFNRASIDAWTKRGNWTGGD